MRNKITLQAIIISLAFCY